MRLTLQRILRCNFQKVDNLIYKCLKYYGNENKEHYILRNTIKFIQGFLFPIRRVDNII